MSNTAAARLDPSRSRRITFTATAYLRTGTPSAGWYDLHSAADGGEQWSMPAFVIDEDGVRDAPPERLTGGDWDELRGRLESRYGPGLAGELLLRWRALADEVDTQRLRALGDRFPVPLRGLPADSVTALPLDERLGEIERRYRRGGYDGAAPGEREAGAVITHLLHEIDQLRGRPVEGAPPGAPGPGEWERRAESALSVLRRYAGGSGPRAPGSVAEAVDAAIRALEGGKEHV